MPRLRRLPAALLIAASVGAGLAAPTASGAAPPRAQDAVSASRPSTVPRGVPKGAPRHALRRTTAPRKRVARAAMLTESNVSFTCSYVHSSAQAIIYSSATFGARPGESVWTRMRFRVWSPTRDEWIYRPAGWHVANPGATGALVHFPVLSMSKGEWVKAVVDTWSPSTGWLEWTLHPRITEPYGFGTFARLSGEWCLPWP